jgi:hypothetical protein
MNYRYYLGEFNIETNLFHKNMGRDRWEKLKCDKMKLTDNSRKLLQYYTMDRCFIKDKLTGKIYTEKYNTIVLVDNNTLKVQVENRELPFFPTQYNYFNKQIHNIEEYRDKTGNIITFSNYKENGIDYYEIYSSSSISSSSL